MYPWVDYSICIRQLQIHTIQSTQRTSKSTPKFLSEKRRWKCVPTHMPRLPQCHLGNPQVDFKTYIKWLNIIPHCHHGYPHARHTSSVLKSKIFNPIIMKLQREKLNSSQQDREGKTPYDPSILTKAAEMMKIKHITTLPNSGIRARFYVLMLFARVEHKWVVGDISHTAYQHVILWFSGIVRWSGPDRHYAYAYARLVSPLWALIA